MTKYEHLTSNYQELKKLKLPKFQRGLVWTEQKKLDLIATLHKGFPFGSLLIYSKNEDSRQLLDGQQRLSTVMDYENNKIKYWRDLNREYYNKKLKEINLLLGTKQNIESKKFEEILEESYELADWTDDFDDMDKQKKKEIRAEIIECRDTVKNYLDLDTLQIPLIRFTGEQKDLPEVFENLNKGGTPLNKYEILNAAWSEDVLTLPNDDQNSQKILENVKEYYTNIINESDFELDNFSEDEITDTRTINLAEFSRALGDFAVAKLPALFSKGDKKAANEMGFGILGISTDTDNKEIATMNTKTKDIQKNITKILDNTALYCQKLNDTFSKILKQNISHNRNGNSKRDIYSTGLSTSFKTLSYFASFWNQSDEYISESLKNIPAYYIFDYLNSSWTAHGDQRLKDYYQSISNKNYSDKISKDAFYNSFKQWQDENTGIKKGFSKELKALITIHSNLTYLAKEIPNGEDYEFEHIIPKARVLEYDSKLKNVKLSSFGNGMFLPKTLNNNKKDKTLYEISYEGIAKYKEASYPTKEEFNEIFKNLKEKNYEQVNKYIDTRSEKMIYDITKSILQ